MPAIPVRLIAIGSPFGEDKIAWQTADALKQADVLQPFVGEQLEFIKLDRPGVSLLNEMEGAETVILLDAAVSNEGDSEVRVLTVDELINEKPQVSSHGFGVQQALALGRALAQLPGELIIIALVVANTNHLNLLESKSNIVSQEMLAKVEQAVLSHLQNK